MRTGKPITVLSMVVFLLISASCTGTSVPVATVTLEPTPTQEVQCVIMEGPACPNGFEESQDISEEVQVSANSTLTLTLGSTPSIPCGWQPPEIGEESIVRQMDHQSKWPAEGVTPMPGAPGTEIWVFETLTEGRSTISLRCMCLGEEGTGEELTGTFSLNVMVR